MKPVFLGDTALAITQQVLKGLQGEADIHQILKVIYFAEQYYLKEYGSSLFNDTFVAMEYGPVASGVYDYLKAVAGKPIKKNVRLDEGLLSHFRASFSTEKYPKIQLTQAEIDLDTIAEAAQEAVAYALTEYGHLNFEQRTSISHDWAWNQAGKNQVMKPDWIAQAAEAPEDTLTYIRDKYDS